jgi:hypothetical protein
LLVTWQEKALDSLELPAGDVLSLEYSETIFRNRRLNNWKSNKYKQFFLVLKGLEVLTDRQCDYVIKVRTDQQINLSLLVDFVQSSEELQSNRILTLFADDRTIDQWPDFAFGGDPNFLKSLISRYMNSKELHSSIHKDFFYSLLLDFRSPWKAFISKLLIPYRQRFSVRQLKNIQTNWKDNFQLMPMEVLQSLEWRGALFNRSDLEHYYGFEEFEEFINIIRETKAKKNPFPINLASIDALTIFFPSNVSDTVTRVKNGIVRRIKNLLC